jgi:hypothetical protein
MRQHFLAVVFFIIVIFVCLFSCIFSSLAETENMEESPSDSLDEQIGAFSTMYEINPYALSKRVKSVYQTIISMQPAFKNGYEGGLKRAREISWLLVSYGYENDLDPNLLAAIAMRESSFKFDNERGYALERGRKIIKRGRRGEGGIFQLMPKGVAYRMMDHGCSMFDRECNVQGAVRFLKRCRDYTDNKFGRRNTTYTWVAAFGRKKVLPPHEARRAQEVLEARRLLCKTVDYCEDIWPR